MDRKEFSSPTALYRPAPFWSWNDKLDEPELRRQIREMADKGWGGYFMHSRVGLVTGYLSEEWMQLVKACADEAKSTGTYAWLYDEDKWPSGFAGGKVSENPEYRSRALVVLKKEEIRENDTVLDEYADGNTIWYICKRIAPYGSPWFNGTCYVDLMNPEAVKAFIDCTHEKYKEACGDSFGKEIPGIFTDEPCYLRPNDYHAPAVPWSDFLPEFFRNRKGYSIEDHLKELFFDIKDYRHARYDFYDSAVSLFLESFTKQYYKWCEDNNLIMTGHFMAEDNLPYQIQYIGAAMPHYEFMHWPGIDKLSRHIEQLVTVKQLTSVVDQLNKERSFCEVFGCIGQQSGFYHRKWIADWQAVLGISFVNHHLSLYSMRGQRKRDYPANLYYQQPWWEDEKQFGDYIGRLSYAVSQGKRVLDILVFHPMGSAWSEYSPLHASNNMMVERGMYDQPFERLSKSLMANKLDFHYGDEMIMEQHARVENGRFIIGQHSYSAVVVPPALTLRKHTAELLKQFAEQAGEDRLVFVKPAPTRIDGMESMQARIPGTIVSSTDEAVKYLDGMYPKRIKINDQLTGKNADRIICHQRQSGNEKWILLANTDEEREAHAEISLPGTQAPKMLDLTSGQLLACNGKAADGCYILEVKFCPAGSLILHYTEDAAGVKPAPAYLDSGVQFVHSLQTECFAEDWQVSLLESNVLPLNDVTLYINHEVMIENKPVAMGWQAYYDAPEGTPFKVIYTFDVLNQPDGEIFAAVETAENLDKLTFNGNEVHPLKARGELGAFNPDKSWKDINFTKVPITGLVQAGRNELILEGRKSNNITGPGTHIGVKDFRNHMATEMETVYIVGNFSVVNEDNTRFYLDGNMTIPDPKNLTASGYPFYAGRAEFKAKLHSRKTDCKPVYLKLNGVKAACAEVFVNGKYAGTKYWVPYLFDVSDLIHEGENEIRIVVPTTLFNLMGPNRIASIETLPSVGPGTFVDFSRYTERYTLLPFGIEGASLVFHRIK